MFESEIPEDQQAPDFSIVTVCLNSESTIRDTLESVRDQKGVTKEHIIKDGGSRDATRKISQAINPEVRIVEKHDRGVYDAMNQGFQVARGRVVAFLNSDDYYANDRVLAKVLDAFLKTGCDLVFGDIRMIDEEGRTRRRWQGRDLRHGTLGSMQLPHPAVFLRKEILDQIDPPFDPSYRISADLKQQLILIEKKFCNALYIPEELTCMRIGGESTGNLGGVATGWAESARAYREVHGRSGVTFVIKKVSLKLKQLRYFKSKESV